MTQPVEVRFHTSYTIDPETGCHLWTKALKRSDKVDREGGYGRMWFRGTVVGAHQVAFYLKHGRWQRTGYDLDHTCETRRCVNADHLIEVKHRKNVQFITKPHLRRAYVPVAA